MIYILGMNMLCQFFLLKIICTSKIQDNWEMLFSNNHKIKFHLNRDLGFFPIGNKELLKI